MSTSIPSAIPAFMTIAAGALPANFNITLGQVFGPYVSPQALLITDIPVTLDAYAELGPSYRHEEHYNFQCFLCSTAGDPNSQLERLSEVYALYDDISVAVANNPNLNSTVRLAWCRQLGYTPTYDVKGLAVGSLRFEVQCQQRSTSLS
jgi:hypothetical protein